MNMISCRGPWDTALGWNDLWLLPCKRRFHQQACSLTNDLHSIFGMDAVTVGQQGFTCSITPNLHSIYIYIYIYIYILVYVKVVSEHDQERFLHIHVVDKFMHHHV